MKDPAFLFYSKDWITGTSEMLPEEKGIYIDLLCYQHQNGDLPTDTKRLAKIVGMAEIDFLKLWETVGKKFTLEQDRLINIKLKEVMSDRADKGNTNRIIGVFSQVLRKADLSKKEYNFVRKEFKVEEFKQIDSERLSERISEWLSIRLKSIGNGNEDVNGNEDDINKEEEIKLHPLQKFIKEKLHNVSKLKTQLTYEDATKLLEKYGQDLVKQKLLAMENTANLAKKYNSVYLTVNNWASMSKPQETKPTNPAHALFKENP